MWCPLCSQRPDFGATHPLSRTSILHHPEKLHGQRASCGACASRAPARREFRAIVGALSKRDLRIFRLGPDTADDGTKEGMRLATIHRVKGLESDRVVIASVNAGLVPQRRAFAGAGDAAEREKAETKERALLYVAATRAKKELLILSYGRPSPFLS